ncbi:hypothetical protein CF319_g7935 [Tilletia indica]|nr:hypothetical protein CF319_g7935 [Tilletia indica]
MPTPSRSHVSDADPDPASSVIFSCLNEPDAIPVGLDAQLGKLVQHLFLPLQGKGPYRTLRAPSGAILHGPPGTGKTLLVRHAAWKARMKVVSLRGSDINNKYLGASEKQAKGSAPAIVIIDEIDCLFPARDSSAGDRNPSILAQLLTELDHVRDDRVALVATTNIISHIDPALLRRLPLKIEIPLPAIESRRAVIEEHLAPHRHSLSQQQLDMLASMTQGCSCSDLTAMVDAAIYNAAWQAQSETPPPPGKRRRLTLPDLKYRHFELPNSSVSPHRIHVRRGRRHPSA